MATQPTPVEARGIVAVLRGNAPLIRADGTRVALKVGDEVQAGQHIVTEEGTRLELTLPNGQPLTIGAARELVIDANLLGLAPIDKTEAALTNLNSGATQIAQAIASGGDLSTQLEATAAGLAGGEGSDQHGFMRVLSFSEDLLRSQVALSLSRDAVATSAPGIDDTSANTATYTVSAAAAQATVFELGLTNVGDTRETTTGSIAVSAPAGLRSITLVGGTDSDKLPGGLGVDAFTLNLADKGAVGAGVVDVVTDFNNAAHISGGDCLHLSDLLQGENHGVGAGNLASYLHFEKAGSDTVVHISSSGAYASGFNAAADDQVLRLTGVDLTVAGNDTAIINDLLSKGKLIVD